MTPYSGTTFFSFLFLLLQRTFLFFTGQLPATELASDELQILVLAGVALSASLVGTLLVLRKQTMLANSLSHTILVGIVGVYVLFRSGSLGAGGGLKLEALLFAAVLMGLVTSFVTQFFQTRFKLQEDASIGLVFSMFFALGILFTTVAARNAHIGIEIVMGNVDALHGDDLYLVGTIFAINAILIALFFKEYLLTTFDRTLAKSLGYSLLFFDTLLMVQTSFTAVAGFRAVGVLMILAFLTAPPLIARCFTHSLGRLLFLAGAVGVLTSIFGVALTRHLLSFYDLALSTGGVVVCLLTLFYAAAFLFQWRRGGAKCAQN